MSRKISIKWKIFITFLAFTIVLIAVLWFFQVVYLNDVYKLIKRNETETIMKEVESFISNNEDASDFIDELAASNNCAIYITDVDGNPVYNAEYISNSRMSSLPKVLFDKFYSEAEAAGGEIIVEFKGSEMMNSKPAQKPSSKPDYKAEAENEPAEEMLEEPLEIIEEFEEGRLEYTIPKDVEIKAEPFRQNFGNELAESIIYVRIVTIDSIEYVLMVNSVITPLDATVSTLKSELCIISLIMIIIGFAAAFGISATISKSIIKTNEGAKRLAEGDYNVSFNSHDYKEIAQLSDTLNYAASELGKADALQKELISNVSHDLRTPLTMIKGYSEVMRDIPGENTPENVQVIIDETERLTGLVNDMLDISKLKAGTIEIQPEMYNFTASVQHVLTRYNKLREAEGYTIDFKYDCQVEILADEQKMYQVIYNLINNAINYTGEDKKVTVEQKVIGTLLRLEVTDTGKGVSQEDIPYVWDRYYKDKSAHKRALMGTGLGLSIVKSVLELHGAKYGVFSKANKGATFWFEIPMYPYDDIGE